MALWACGRAKMSSVLSLRLSDLRRGQKGNQPSQQMLSPPFLNLGKSSRWVQRMLSCPFRNPNPNSSPRLRTMGTGTRKTLICHLPHLSNPSNLPPNHGHLHALAPKSFSRSTIAYSRSSVISASETRDIELKTVGSSSPLVVVSFYRFADFPDHAEMRMPLRVLCEELRISGGIILAPEGINGSICGTIESVNKVLEFIQADERLKGLRMTESPVSPEEEAIHHGHTSHSPLGAGEDAPFRWDHVRIKVKKEIVSFGDPSVTPTKRVGKYVHPKDWNDLISDPDTVVIDVRNSYETRIGKFKRAVDPCTTAFREFPHWADDKFQMSEASNQQSCSEIDQTKDDIKGQPALREPQSLPRVAMYCTGGIRCEKASSFLLDKGFKEVYHLEGGILRYLEEVPEAESLWEGECFVFDKRVSVEHGLVQGTFKLCYGCKQPVSDADMEAPEWEYGVSCPYCFSVKSTEEKERARARQRQFESCGVIGGPDKVRKSSVRSEACRDEETQ